MTEPNQTRFNQEAANWDSNPSVLLATELALRSYLPFCNPSLDILDLGCGTGLLSLLLAPHVRSVTAVDPAPGMIDVLTAKLSPSGSHQNVKNVLPVCALLEDPNDPRLQIDPLTKATLETGTPVRKFDLVVSHLVLHHIPDLPAVFKTIYGLLKPGGKAAVTDFEDFGPEARKFHPESKMDGVERHGIKREDIHKIIEGAGFEGVTVETAFELPKRVESEPGKGDIESGPTMVFPFLICSGVKP
ncbi:S-adenosyl-L-methionine-dependent methyltransferase [Apiosordaria backusii]|uniref:S-adenosyl-L-methionine-dependent methyltransferase n=1 Tax=Apiosordaria backusii TaxID=314023 RepID=A0AA40E3Z4_9PEZI|nr:S-adenosyl-L-methionine-dependent methyltransferase [Apiosordaria backusii]